MSLLSKLFKSTARPAESYTDAVLGEMRYSTDDEAWIGMCSGHEYSLAYEKGNTPDEGILAYAREVIMDTNWLNTTLSEARQTALGEHPSSYADEIRSLRFGMLHFYTYRGKKKIIVDLNGGGGCRSWRIEYTERTCEGIGFDD